MSVDSDIQKFLAGPAFAVAGASQQRAKYGNKVLRCYWQKGLTAYPVNPNRTEIEGRTCFADLSSLPEPVHGLSLITQPEAEPSLPFPAYLQNVFTIANSLCKVFWA